MIRNALVTILATAAATCGHAADDTRPVAVIHVTHNGQAVGDIHLTLFPATAPKTVANFIKLADSKFYDGTTFHRVVPGFVIQGGDPNTKPGGQGQPGTGGPGYTIDAEVGPSNPEKHLIGTLAMARAQDINSAGSQFYVTLAAEPSLDWPSMGGYTVFGRCVGDADIQVCQKVQQDDRMTVEIVKAGEAGPADVAAPKAAVPAEAKPADAAK
jgi:cyclophilin family peptidyl-prolyl cis-trans isomerase